MQFDERFFDAGIDRMGTQCAKWEAPDIADEDMIPLWVADMDFACAPAIVEALVQRARRACYGYTFPEEADQQAVCDFWKRRHQVDLAPAQVGMLPTVITGLKVCVEHYTKPGEGVILQSPVYGPFYTSVALNRRRVLDAPLVREADGAYRMDLQRVEDHLKAGARLMLLCSPHNPVSRVWTREELQALGELLARYGAVLAADEIHADFVYAPHHFFPALRLDVPGLKVVSLVSAAKSFNIAGLQQASLLVRDSADMEAFGSLLSRSGVEAGNLFALTANRAAYTHGDAWLDGVVRYLDGSRALLKEQLAALLPDAVLSPIEGTFLGWVDVRAYGIGEAQLKARLRENKVALTEGTFFGKDSGNGFMRINFGCPRSQLAQGLERFAKAVKG